MNKSTKPSSSVARQQMKPLTPEEMKEQQMRMYLQKKSSLAEGILFNLVQSNGRDLCYDLDSKTTSDYPLKIVKMADEMATEFMKVVYKAEVTEDTEEE